MDYNHKDLGYEDISYPESRYPDSKPYGGMGMLDSPIKAIVQAVLKRPWLTIITFFVIMVPVLFYIYSQVQIFRSATVISLPFSSRPGVSNPQFSDFLMDESGITEDYFYAILGSRNYKEDILSTLIERMPHLPSDSLRSAVYSGVGYSTVSRSNRFLAIEGHSESPEFAKVLAEQSVKSLEKQIQLIRRSDAQFLIDYVDKLLSELNDQLARAEANTQQFLQEKNLRVEDVASGMGGELASLESELAESEARRDMARLQIDTYTRQIDERLKKFLSADRSSNEAKIRRLKDRVSEINKTIGDSLGSYTDTAAFLDLQTERKEILAQLLELANSQNTAGEGNGSTAQISLRTLQNVLANKMLEYENAQIETKYFKMEIDEFMSMHPNLPNDILEYINMSRSKEVLKKAIDILVEKRETARINMVSEGREIKVIDSPVVPKSPVPAKRNVKLAFALIAALTIGIGIAYIVDLFDTTVQSERDIIARFNLPVYGSVPVLNLRSFRGKRIADLADPSSNGQVNLTQLNYHTEASPVAEAYRSLRTSIQFTSIDKKKKVFVVSSSVAAEGKSLTAYNLGVSFAQGGFRTLVLDADLRRASQHKLFMCEREPGLTDCLFDKAEPDEVIHESNVPNLCVLAAGMRVKNPADLLSSDRMRKLVELCESRFDIVLIDTPPISPCMDSRNIASIAGGMVLIARAELTKLPVLEHCINLCKRINIELQGIIINHASFRYSYGYYYIYQRNNPYGYYYYSGYRYAYYYSSDLETGEKTKQKRKERQRRSRSKSRTKQSI